MCDHFKQENVKKHFTHKNHDGFISEASITFIDKTDHSDPSKRTVPDTHIKKNSETWPHYLRKCLTTPYFL